MTGRILAGFLSVLIAVIVAIVVPLGLTVAGQQRHDFRAAAIASARALAAVVDEKLDDRSHRQTLPPVLARAAGDDAVVVLDAAGSILATAGARLPAAELAAARGGKPLEDTSDSVVVSALIGEQDRPAGRVVLSRVAAPLQGRVRSLWLALSAAAVAAVVVGSVVGWSLARWIAAPLKSLIGAAHGIGSGTPSARADDSAGPAQVRDVAAAFNDMAGRVGSLLEAQRGMTAEVSHQLRTPLAALRLRLELLSGEVDGELGVEIVAMLAETNRLSRLLDGLLTIARAEAVVAAPTPTHVADVSAARIAAWAPVATERSISLQLQTRPVVAAVTPGHLEQILDNLLANAIDAVPAGGFIKVVVDAGSGTAVLRVADSGAGMTADQRAHAFGRFVTDRGGHGGTGLGLAIVGRLLATDHGTATLDQTPGGGLTVEIRLPATTRQLSADPQA
ncbi:MAG: sensor histidine kinase [Mycobacteriales bacterium]